MKGKTGTNTSTVFYPTNNSQAAINGRQKRLKAETKSLMPCITRARAIASRKSNPGAYMNAVWKNVMAVNDLYSDIEHEYEYTLVRNGTEPVRHQLMSRKKARHFNKLNYHSSIPLKWVQGKQPLQKHKTPI